jgi:hypothetical protein
MFTKNKKMRTGNYNASITVDSSPDNVFKSINNVSKWWTDDLEGNSQNTGDEFTVRFGDIHVSSQRLIEVIPGKKVVWLVTGSNLNFIKQKDEWTDTKICFEITTTNDNKTTIEFTHFGLNPGIECYNSCSKGWDYYFKGSLFKLLTEGKGMPGL